MTICIWRETVEPGSIRVRDADLEDSIRRIVRLIQRRQLRKLFCNLVPAGLMERPH